MNSGVKESQTKETANAKALQSSGKVKGSKDTGQLEWGQRGERVREENPGHTGPVGAER